MDVAELLSRILATPAARETAFAALRRAISADERTYEELHWGRKAHGTHVLDFHPPRRAVQLGYLSRIGYLTRKGDDQEFVEYIHTFGERTPNGRYRGARPWLCVAPPDQPDGPRELVIVRGESLYDVTTHGIEG